MSKNYLPLGFKIPSKKELAKSLAKMQHRNYPSLERIERERRVVRADFIKRAEVAGFSKPMAEFLYENLALSDHKHWDGRLV